MGGRTKANRRIEKLAAESPANRAGLRKTGHREMPPFPIFSLRELLNRDFALHAERNVRRAVVGYFQP